MARSQIMAEMTGGIAHGGDDEDIGDSIDGNSPGSGVKRVSQVARVKWAIAGSGTCGDNSNSRSSGGIGGFGNLSRALLKRRQSIAAGSGMRLRCQIDR